MKRIITILLSIMTLMCGFTVNANAMSAHYTELGVPNINSSYKTWMDYGTITAKGSPQYKYIGDWCWVDWEGFVRCNGERDLGIEDDYYAVALGSYYGSTIGTKYRVTLNSGNVIYCVLCDQKANCDTNSTNQYAYHNDILEFVVNTTSRKNKKQWIPGCGDHYLNRKVMQMGDANYYTPLNGTVTKIERIDFY